jgi:hypothetical protein
MRPCDILSFEAIAGSLLEELGYERFYRRVPPLVRLKGFCIQAALDLKYAGSKIAGRMRDFASQM